jgi:hypothetical protein
MSRKKAITLALATVLIIAAGLSLLYLRPQPETEDTRAAPAGVPAPARSEALGEPAPDSRENEGLVDLGPVLAFSGECDIDEPLASIFTAMVKLDPQTWEASAGDPVPVPGFERPIAPTFERTVAPLPNGSERHVIAGLPLTGTWHGLRVVGLKLDFFEESDVSSRQILFEQPAEPVRDALRAAGFDLPPVGDFREMEGEGMLPSIGVDREGSGAALICTTG